MAMGEPSDYREHTVSAGQRYFGSGIDHILALEFPVTTADREFALEEVPLPDWAADLGVGSPPILLVDPCCIAPGDGATFERCDWLQAAHLHLSGWLERSVEDRSGPVQSYAFRLPGAWSRAYDHAWVNRIFLFLRRYAARRNQQEETELFGPKPEARFYLSHDVDALNKTVQLRLKATVMSGIATLRHLLGGRMRSALSRVKGAIEFAATNADYWLFDQVCAAEDERGFRSMFMFADNAASRGPVPWLIDPSYKATEPRVAALIRDLHERGWQIGIHPGFNTWNDADQIASTREQVAAALDGPVTDCRQHWLRFSWRQTWAAQSKAGVTLDFTLGFNDRSGFRNGAALCHHPWDREAHRPHALKSIPTIIMDSHFHDYAFPEDPAAAMVPWVDEVIAVGGEASLLWHVHTMHDEYGWGPSYLALLDLLAARGAAVSGHPVDG